MPEIAFVNCMNYEEMSKKGKTKRTIFKALIPDSDETLEKRIVRYVRDSGMAIFPDSRIFVMGEEFVSQTISKEAYKKQTSFDEMIRAIRHHINHGDMSDGICLLAECSLHYPKVKRTWYCRDCDKDLTPEELFAHKDYDSKYEAHSYMRLVEIVEV